MDDLLGGRTCVRSVLILIALAVVVDSAIYIHESAVPSFRRRLQKLDISTARQLLHRRRRSSTTGNNDNGTVLAQEVGLRGTERHTHAYVHWSGKLKSEAVFMLTLRRRSSRVLNSQMWRSLDYGTSYIGVQFPNGTVISQFFVSHVNHTKVVLTDVNNKCLYTSTNELRTKKINTLPAAADDIMMHPSQSDWMLLYDYSNKQLYVTQDFGSNWTLLQSDVGPKVFWGLPDYDDDDVVHMEIQPEDAEQSFYKRCRISQCQLTEGIDRSLGPVVPGTVQVINEYVFAQKAHLDGSHSHMMVSYKRGNFSNTFFPDNVETQDFILLDGSEGQVFVAVNHGNNKGASLYLSDPTGRFYVLSLSNVHHLGRRNWFEVDMHKVKGLTGIFLANQELKGNHSYDKHVKSLISFNKGGDWSEVRSPLDTDCHSDNCSFVLRLDMGSYRHSWILSETRAPGLLVAHGHYGSNYYSSWRNMSVFTSNDGGWSWIPSSLRGVYHFNILDQGGIVTAVHTSYMQRTNLVYYSYDEGHTWRSTEFWSHNLSVDGVLNEPDISTLVVNIYGHASYSGPWTMVKLNFSQVLSRQCDEPTDYENWMASDHDTNLNENCLLGQEVIYRRRKPGSVCYNGEAFNRTIEKRACECSDEDFECDFGFSLNGTKCQREPWFDDGYIATECFDGQKFNKSRGYRKVGADHCQGGVASQPKYQADSNAICPVVKADHLVLVTNTTLVGTYQPIFFHLSQRRGSKHTTSYFWDFKDNYNTTVTDLDTAQAQIHYFRQPGVYHVTVTASNSNGTSSSNGALVRVEDPVNRVAVFTPWAVRVGKPFTLSVSTNLRLPGWDFSLHYLYRFGDEAQGQKDMLLWTSNVSHTYNRSGTYIVSVTGLNSISSVTKQSTIEVVDDGIMAEMTLSLNAKQMFGHANQSYFNEHAFYLLELFRSQLTLMMGVSLGRMSVSLHSTYPLTLSFNSSVPVIIDVLIMQPSSKAAASEMSSDQIAQAFVDMACNDSFSFSNPHTYFFYFGGINVTDVLILGDGNCTENCTGNNSNSTDSPTNGGHRDQQQHGVDYRAVYITVPVVILAGLITLSIIIYYRSKRSHRLRRYTSLGQDDTTDALLDDDDDGPLNMTDARDTGRSNDDELMLTL